MKAGWQVKLLGDLCRIRTGKKDVNQGNPDGEYPFFTCAAEHTYSDSFSFDTEALLIAGNGNVGQVSYYKGKFEAYQRTYVLSDFADVLPRFLYLILDGKLKDKVSKQKLGNTMPYIKVGMLTNFSVPLPPVPEQHRIVAILDEAFVGIATAKANAEKNLQNARALFESHLQAVFSQRGVDWLENEKPLSELCELIVDCEHKTAPTQETGIPSIRTPNIGKGKLLLDGVYRVSEETYKEWTRRAEPLAGDLILAREAPAGNVAVIPENLKVCLGQRTVLIRPNRSVFESAFLALLLLQPAMQQKLLAHSRGATVQHVNMKDIRALKVEHIPSITEQRQIVSVFNKMTEEAKRLETIYQQKLAALDELKKSLLHQAFSGQLTAECVEKARIVGRVSSIERNPT